jgi:hypothetical protein
MVIIDLTKITRSFDELRIGRVFKREYEEGSQPDYCIKIPEFVDDRTKEKFNAINLEDGSWCQFERYEMVIPYEATLQLEQ